MRAGSKDWVEIEDGGDATLSRIWTSLCVCGILTWLQDSLQSDSRTVITNKLSENSVRAAGSDLLRCKQ